MILQTNWRTKQIQNFYPAFRSATDYGACCLITPYLDFEMNKSQERAGNYTGEEYHSIPKGFTRNGIKNGLEVILDVESYEYAYFTKGAKGFQAVVGDSRDKQIVNQDGFYIVQVLLKSF